MSSNRQPNNDRFADYVSVAERLSKFYERCPEGRIVTSIVQHDIETGFVLMRAEVFRKSDDASPSATGHAFEVRGESYVNKTSYVENAETSSVGRALAMLGFEVKRGIASREEMQKTVRGEQKPGPRPVAPATEAVPVASLDKTIMGALETLGKTEDDLNRAAVSMFSIEADSFDWTDLSVARRMELLDFLNRTIDKRTKGMAEVAG